MKVSLLIEPEPALCIEPENDGEAQAVERWHLAVHEAQAERTAELPLPTHLVTLTRPGAIFFLVCDFARFARLFFGIEPMPEFTEGNESDP